MTKRINPFYGTLYNPAKVGNFADLLVPPYDVIPHGEEQKYWGRSLYNFAHLDLPHKPEDDYTGAAERLKKWRELGVLVEDTKPYYYLYEQKFTLGNRNFARKTLMCTVELADFSEGIVRPHENTHGKHKKDRLQIVRATGAQFSHIFGMVKDRAGVFQTSFEEWMYRDPLFSAVTDDGVTHTLWRVATDKATAIESFMANEPVYIVDGHHRYESALAYAKEVGAYKNAAHPASRMLFAIANVFDPSLVVLPTHRWVRGVTSETLKRTAVETKFELTPMTLEELTRFTAVPQKTVSFGLYVWDQLFLATPKAKPGGSALSKLAVAWSDNSLLKDLVGITEDERSQKIQYEKNVASLWEKKGPTELMIFHAPPSVELVTEVADEKGFMPQKTTYFYPKLFVGLCSRRVDANAPV